MEFLLSLLTIFFVALLLAAALTFGFALLVWFVIAALVVTCVIMLREAWHRWRFLRSGRPAEDNSLIEGEYEEISQKRK